MPDGMEAGIDELLARRLPAGGFSGQPGGGLRVDATAWAALALLRLADAPAGVVATARDRLAAVQQPDGRLIILPGHRGAVWPTALAALAWQGSTPHQPAHQHAIAFLLATEGQHSEVGEGTSKIMGHDMSLRGWPWIAGTHSWVEPTALAVIALRAAGHGSHARVEEALRLLTDRQLSSGGWNYGNTLVFGQELRPMPETTGAALAALAGRVTAAEVAPSLTYLAAEVERVRTPLSLGWGLFGLSAWERRPPEAERWADEALGRPAGMLPYDTAELAILHLAQHAPAGLLAALALTEAA